MRSETLMLLFLSNAAIAFSSEVAIASREENASKLGCDFPAVEPLGIHDARLLVITDRFIERLHLGVLRPHQQLQLGDAGIAEPGFGCIHHRTAMSLAAMIRIDRDIVDPAAVALMANHCGCDDGIAIASDQDG